MRRSPAALYPVYAALCGGAGLLAFGAALQSVARPGSVPVAWLTADAALFVLLAVPATALAYALRPAASLSFDLAYLLAACVLFPPGVAIVIGVLAGWASAPLAGRSVSARDLAAEGAVSSGTLAAMAAAAGGVAARWRTASAPYGTAGWLALLAGAFATIVAVHLLAASLARWMRGHSPAPSLKTLARTLPADLLAIPLALLFILNFQGEERLGFLLLSGLSVVASWLLRRLERTRADLSGANRDLRRRIDELQGLGEIGRELTTSLSPRQVLEAVARECRRMFPGDLFAAGLFDPETLETAVHLVQDPSGRPRDGVPPAGLGRAVGSGFRPLLVRDLRREPLSEPLRGLPVSPAVRAVIVSPVTVEGRCAGFLSVQSRRAGAYDPPALSLLRTAAGQAGMALESARNYQRAIRDELTELYQREYFFERLREELQRSERYHSAFAVLMLDLDGFKALNDRFGHVAGDQYLRAVGQAIAGNLRAADVPCRYGGEEFCLLLPETDLAGARAIAERIRESVAALAVRHGAEVLRATISIGVSVHPVATGATVTPIGLVQQADEALYAAKRAGKNRVMAAAA